MSKRAILFDLDGTLVDSERESAEAMARALAEGQGIEIDQQDRDAIVGRSWVQIYASLQARYEGLRWSRDELIAATAAHRESVFEEQGITILPGAIDVVQRFQNWPKAIVTGSSRVEAAQALRALDLVDAFDFVIAAEDVATSKPAPDGYLQASERLCIDPRSCLVIEDSQAGIAAGLAAQMSVVAVAAGNFAGHDQSGAHRLLQTLDELSEGLVHELLS